MEIAFLLVAIAAGVLSNTAMKMAIALIVGRSQFRTIAAGTLALAPGFRLKASAELYAFSNDVPVHQDLELAFHLAVVGTF